MIASLNQSSSLSSFGAALMSATVSMAQPSRETPEQQGGVLLLIDAQADPTPLEVVPFAHLQFIFVGVEIFLLTGYRFVLHQLETIVDAVIVPKPGGHPHSPLKHPSFPLLPMPC